MLRSIKKIFGIREKSIPQLPTASWPVRPMPPMRPRGGFNTSTFSRETAADSSTPASPVSPATTPVVTGPQSVTSLSLSAIIEKLPANLRRLLGEVAAEGVKAHIPTALIQSQIASGVVRLTFGELRQYVPPGFFVAGKNLDLQVVELPLQEIIARIDPALLPRRNGQRQMVVPTEIAGPFASEEQLSAVKIVQKPAAPAPAPSLQPQFREVQPGGTDPFAAVFDTTRFERSSRQNTAPGHVTSPEPKPEELFLRKAPVAPAPAVTFHAPIQMNAPVENVAVPEEAQPILAESEAPKPHLERIRVQLRPPQPSPAAEPAVEDKGFITVALSDLCKGWPESLKAEIMAQQLYHSTVPLPVAVVEVGMRQGTVALPWRIVRSWLKPTPMVPQSVHDPIVVDFPLSVITPPFLAALKGTKTQAKISLDPQIPDVFMHAGQSEPAASNTLAFTPAPVPAPVPVNAPAPLLTQTPATTTAQLLQANQPTATLSSGGTSYFNAANSGEEEVTPPALRPNGTVGTEFLKKHASPAEIVNKAMALPHVEGVLITLPDGLLIAGKVPPTINAEAMAGFVPQIYGRVMQSAKELRMGELNNLTFTVGQVPWRIFKVSAIYFAAFGSMGASLPTADLAQLASELNRNPS